MKVAIFGSGGHSSEIADICDSIGYKDIIFIVPDETHINGKYSTHMIVETNLLRLHGQGFVFAIGISDGAIRERIYQKYPQLTYPNFVHSASTLGRGVKEELALRKGVIIAAGTRFMNSVTIGDFSIYGLNCTIGHDSIIADYVSVMPGVNISGYVHLDRYSYVGSGATVIQGAVDNPLYLNRGVIVGAGAVVTKSYYDARQLVGIPARNRYEK